MAFDAFLKIDGIAGESSDAKHKDELEIFSFSFGCTQPTSPTDPGAARASFSDFNVVSRTQKSSPALFLACASGQHIPKAVLTVRKAGGEQQEYLKWTFSDLLVSSFQPAGASGGEDFPTESISFNFSKIEVQYKQIAADGTLGPPITAGWDLAANKKL